jgi:hypothetical protein
MRSQNRRSAWILLGCALFLGACGSTKHAAITTPTATTVAGAVNPNGPESLPPGDIPDNQVFVPYSSETGGYSVKYPEGWAQAQSGATTTFDQNFNTIAITPSRTASAPTLASVTAHDVAALRARPGFKLGKVDTVSRTAGPAVRISYEATSSANPVTGKTVALDVERYLFWHNGRLVTITLSSPKGSDNVDPWRTVTDSFAWK